MADFQYSKLLMADILGSWQKEDSSESPLAFEGEAGYAASGTCLRIENNNLYYVSGGAKSRLLRSENRGKTWQSEDLPIVQGSSADGAYSMAARNENAVAVGGNYANSNSTQKICVVSDGNNFVLSKIQPPSGYRSCVEWYNDEILFSVGTNGTDISFDKGNTWKKFDTLNLNVIRCSQNICHAAGNKGVLVKIVVR